MKSTDNSKSPIIQGAKMFCDDCKRPLSIANMGSNHVISIVCPDCMEKRIVNK